MDRLEGKVALVTGAARGQGRSHSLRFATEGADVIAVDICAPVPGVAYPAATPEELSETARLVESTGRRVYSAKADVRNREELSAVVDEAVNELGRLDVVVANAGICIGAPWDAVTPEIWATTIDINLTGVWNTVVVAVPHLITTGGGSIILTSSAAGLKGMPFLAPYVASKHGVTGLARALAHELARHRIRVNSIHPGAVDTPMAGPELAASIAVGMREDPRLSAIFQTSLPYDSASPEEISNAIVYLASDDARFVTAAAFALDGGNSQF